MFHYSKYFIKSNFCIFTKDQPEFNGLGTKEPQENPPGILKTSDDYQKPQTSANRLIFHSDVIQAGKTRNYTATNQNGFEK